MVDLVAFVDTAELASEKPYWVLVETAQTLVPQVVHSVKYVAEVFPEDSMLDQAVVICMSAVEVAIERLEGWLAEKQSSVEPFVPSFLLLTAYVS
jgi:ABC-type glucose/galactose transport system permease subunit